MQFFYNYVKIIGFKVSKRIPKVNFSRKINKSYKIHKIFIKHLEIGKFEFNKNNHLIFHNNMYIYKLNDLI